MHTGSCGNAVTHQCRCTGCGGALHGWPGLTRIAQPGHAPEREALRKRAGNLWAEATRPRKGRIRLTRAREAATDEAEADIADWIAGQLASPGLPALTDDITATLGQKIADEVLPQADATTADKHALRAAMCDHFWCGMLAQIACSMNRLDDEFDKAPEQIASAIQSSRHSEGRAFIEDVTVLVAVKCALKVVRNLPLVRAFDDTKRAVQFLAVFICPAPERHEAVASCCMKPLLNVVISAEVTAKLRQVLPPAWLGKSKGAI